MNEFMAVKESKRLIKTIERRFFMPIPLKFTTKLPIFKQILVFY
jgi:hypothetical protein